jgi:hypothetical protein
MSWTPLPEEELYALFNKSWKRMNQKQRSFWEMVQIEPIKWDLHPWGDQGGGFWVVARIGKRVVWYNDIEEGFNQSPYTQEGIIGDYRCNQDDLEHTIQQFIDGYESGRFIDSHFGPPEPVPDQ